MSEALKCAEEMPLLPLLPLLPFMPPPPPLLQLCHSVVTFGYEQPAANRRVTKKIERKSEQRDKWAKTANNVLTEELSGRASAYC